MGAAQLAASQHNNSLGSCEGTILWYSPKLGSHQAWGTLMVSLQPFGWWFSCNKKHVWVETLNSQAKSSK